MDKVLSRLETLKVNRSARHIKLCKSAFIPLITAINYASEIKSFIKFVTENKHAQEKLLNLSDALKKYAAIKIKDDDKDSAKKELYDIQFKFRQSLVEFCTIVNNNPETQFVPSEILEVIGLVFINISKEGKLVDWKDITSGNNIKSETNELIYKIILAGKEKFNKFAIDEQTPENVLQILKEIAKMNTVKEVSKYLGIKEDIFKKMQEKFNMEAIETTFEMFKAVMKNLSIIISAFKLIS